MDVQMFQVRNRWIYINFTLIKFVGEDKGFLKGTPSHQLPLEVFLSVLQATKFVGREKKLPKPVFLRVISALSIISKFWIQPKEFQRDMRPYSWKKG